MEDQDAILLLLEALTDVSRRGIQITDLHAQIRRVDDDELPPTVRTTRASALFPVVHRLTAEGLARRTARGYELTEEGRTKAAQVRDLVSTSVADEISAAARAVS